MSRPHNPLWAAEDRRRTVLLVLAVAYAAFGTIFFWGMNDGIIESVLTAQVRFVAAPVAVLLGARQTGKTTLVRSLPELLGRPCLTLGGFDLRTAVKRAVDEDPHRTPGRFVLTGSANLLRLERIGETLAGRAVDEWPNVLAAEGGIRESWAHANAVLSRLSP